LISSAGTLEAIEDQVESELELVCGRARGKIAISV
jgi:hypothetical protein